MFFGITMNVFIITISIPFGTGTPIITGLMFLASFYLVCWDYDKLKPLLFLSASVDFRQSVEEKTVHHGSALSRIGYWTLAIAGNLLMCEVRGLMPVNLNIREGALLISFLAGFVMASGSVIDIVWKWKYRAPNTVP